eukprot:301165-Prorocentrum_minimum.AAC.1
MESRFISLEMSPMSSCDITGSSALLRPPPEAPSARPPALGSPPRLGPTALGASNFCGSMLVARVTPASLPMLGTR